MIADSTFLTRVVLRNYKSIAHRDARLGPLTFLVGPNGSGKSNFLDALRFVADALRTSLDHAIRDRGGISEVRRRSGGHPNHFGIRLEFVLQMHWLTTWAPDYFELISDWHQDYSDSPMRTTVQDMLGAAPITGHYEFQIAARPLGGYEVRDEQCELHWAAENSFDNCFMVRSGKVQSSLSPPPAATSDRLYLVNVSGFQEFRPLFDALSRMSFYNLHPDRMRDWQSSEASELLLRDGSNLASVVARLAARDQATKDRIEAYLKRIVPGVQGVDAKAIGPKETLEFRQAVAGSRAPWRFLAENMSDGTLRALGVLAAVFQSEAAAGRTAPLVGIEEPEAALHPAAAGILRDSLLDASARRQILVTSHSPDLLDDDDLDPDSILAVVADAGTTRIGPLDDVGRSALRDHLYTAGDLSRMGQLVPQDDAPENGRGVARQPEIAP